MSHLEEIVTHISIGHFGYFNVDLPLQELILAATGASVKTFSLMSSSELLLPLL